jgi:hypothetical protein
MAATPFGVKAASHLVKQRSSHGVGSRAGWGAARAACPAVPAPLEPRGWGPQAVGVAEARSRARRAAPRRAAPRRAAPRCAAPSAPRSSSTRRPCNPTPPTPCTPTIISLTSAAQCGELQKKLVWWQQELEGAQVEADLYANAAKAAKLEAARAASALKEGFSAAAAAFARGLDRSGSIAASDGAPGSASSARGAWWWLHSLLQTARQKSRRPDHAAPPPARSVGLQPELASAQHTRGLAARRGDPAADPTCLATPRVDRRQRAPQ